MPEICLPRRIILTLPSLPSIGQIILSGFNGVDNVVNRAFVNGKRSGGYTPGGGLRVSSRGSFQHKFIWTVTSVIRDNDAMAVLYRDLVQDQEVPPYIGQVVLTDQNTSLNARETLLGTRSIVPGSTVTIGGIARSEIAARVFIETPGEDEDIIKPFGKGGWRVEFTATEI